VSTEKTQMTHEEHRERHKLLHDHLDELVADWIRHHPPGDALPSKNTVMDLVLWSSSQAVDPDEAK
jgi:hypothetical protein